ncbi:MAG: methyl-accepting chemotaxis protein [Candidatus Aureabacteria bacterium]|nr:methyl-accepting chemotaxis protein [Candidatus Auribacterota bacterium]
MKADLKSFLTDVKKRILNIVPASWALLNIQEKLFTALALPVVIVMMILLVLTTTKLTPGQPFIVFIVVGTALVIYIYVVLRRFISPLYEIIHQMLNMRELKVPMEKEKNYPGDWNYLYAEIVQFIEKNEKTRKTFYEFYEFLQNLSIILKESIIQLEESTRIQSESIEKTSQYLDKITEVMSKIYEDVQSLSISVGNTVFSLQVMGKNINQVALDGQKMGESVFITTQSINQMAEAINEVDRNIENTNALATTATQSAGEGDSVVDHTVAAMSHIHKTMEQFSETIMKLGKRSDEIGKIIATIDDIADQTNLLSLNAAIEAARAGEHGRGFAVVASEVKKLADKTTDATKEITNMIKSIQAETRSVIVSTKKGTDEIRRGVVLADQAGDSLKNIVKTIEEVSVVMNSIADSTKRQSERSSEITKAVEKMNKLTQQVVTATREQNESGQLITQVAVDMQNVANSAVEKLETHDKEKENIRLAMDDVMEATQLSISTIEALLKISDKMEMKILESKRKIDEN